MKRSCSSWYTAGAAGRKRLRRTSQRGFTLFEVLVAVLLLGIISVMIYSVLNVGIKFAQKGEKGIFALERKQGVFTLLRQQVASAWYDPVRKNVVLSGEDDVFRVVTEYPLQYREAGVVLAIYRYDRIDEKLYYIEKRDYYNIDYDDEYIPDYDAMTLLADNVGQMSLAVDPDTLLVSIEYGGQVYELAARCAEEVLEQD